MSRFMAADPSSGPRFFLDEEKNDSFLQNLQDRKSHVPSDVERQSAAAIRAVIDDDDDELELVNPLESRQGVGSSFEEPKSSFVVDLGSDSAPEPGTKPLQTIWSKIQAGNYSLYRKVLNLLIDLVKHCDKYKAQHPTLTKHIGCFHKTKHGVSC